ncbi:MAG: ABC transporter permease [Anaerolineales bacterium]|nr:ABC transporter permease [Anaerolineales bacterium]
MMVLRNLLRRKARTMLTVLGIAIGVAAIVGLGALANGLQQGYSSVVAGSKSDLVLSQPDTFDIAYSAVDEEIGGELAQMPEVAEVTPMLQGYVDAENNPLFIVFAYPVESYIMDRFQVIEGNRLGEHAGSTVRGNPIMLGSATAEAMDKSVGETVRVAGAIFRVVGIYQTGDAFEDGGALLALDDAQDLLGKAHQVSVFYIQLKDPSLRQRLAERVEHRWPDLSLSGTDEFADKQSMTDFMHGFVWVLGGLAIVIGGVGMMNAQLMSVFERTREIGVLRSLGWSSGRVLGLILGESILVSLAGGVLGVGLGWLVLRLLSGANFFFGVNPQDISFSLLLEAFTIVLFLGLTGGLYPALRAAQMQPVEALRYEGGSAGKHVRRLPIGGMAAQSLWQRLFRTALTLGAIALIVGAIMALEGMIRGFADQFTEMAVGGDAQIVIRQPDVADTTLSVIDERIGDQIAAMPEVEAVSGLTFTGVMLPEYNGFFIVQGYAPFEFGIQRFVVTEGKYLTNNHQVMRGRAMADVMNKGVGDTIEVSGVRFRVVGIFESGISWEEMGGVISLRDAQSLVGRPHKVTMYAARLVDPSQAADVCAQINARFPDQVYAALAGDFADVMPDIQTFEAMLNAISFVTILIGGVGVLNTMLMSVMERTREIGVLRALGWRRRQVLDLILREAVILGLLGGIAGIVVAFGLIGLMCLFPVVEAFITPAWDWDVFARAMLVALLLGVLGGLYPAYRATRMQPVEALRYE